MKNIKMIVLVMAVALQLFVGCSDNLDSNEPLPYPPIGTYNTSDEVNADNLIAKWSFDNTIDDTKGGLKGIGTNVAYAEGVKGQAYQGSNTQERYAIYNNATAVGALSSFSFSFWMNSGQTVPDGGSPGQGKGIQGIFSLVNPAGFWGGLNLFLENVDNSKPNTLRLKMGIENKRVAWGGQGPIFNIDGSLDTWIHIVLTYDDVTAKYTVYKNGAIGTNSIYGTPYGPFTNQNGYAVLYGDNPGGPDGSNANPNAAPLYGALVFATPNLSQLVIGSNQFSTTPSLTTAHGDEGWATDYAGLLDEFRIYKTALTPSEVNALYKLESSNR
ncbi:LamG domain-containing protein [Flavobacterium sp. N3904]|uniref:LamG domain-containing protein n=1 Tax=Flavobacterium sp. N3904 TaxID=2986835 RepID=UPI0022258098|nr:LamG domain-containing protein [Flavobacterium sp. N3904]